MIVACRAATYTSCLGVIRAGENQCLPMHEQLDCISPTAIPSLCMSWLRLFGVRSGVYLYPVHAGNTARLHAPYHPHSVDRTLHKLGPVLSTPTSQTKGVLHRSSPSPRPPTSTSLLPPYAIQLRPPACHRRPSPVHTAPPHPPFIDRVCAPDDGVCEEVLGGLGLRLRAAASDRSRREALVAMVPILRHQPSSFVLLLPADSARALHTSAFYLS
ncbi:hypothetical protein B0H14DRAFT_509353 [Mycena olivaceomarginata]|nr:hypothetical protein B0H14DRAFT_509353 [Mycena olivaceomarginata]